VLLSLEDLACTLQTLVEQLIEVLTLAGSHNGDNKTAWTEI
jgi:hypothetical protein